MSIAGIHTLTYNGFSFAGPKSHITAEVAYVYDEAQRTVVADNWKLAVMAWITSDSAGLTDGYPSTFNANGRVIEAHRLLGQSGGELTFSGLGIGDITINTDSTNRDLNFGPRPRILRMKPVGAPGVTEIVWECEAMVKRCSSSPVITGVLGNAKALNFGIDYSVDRRGIMTRNITGYLEIVLNRSVAGSNLLSTTADDYVDQIRPVVPDGFRRDNSVSRLSHDKSRIDFTFTDTEMPSTNAFPPGVSDMQLAHRVATTSVGGAIGQNRTECSLSGRIEVTKTVLMSDAWERVLLLLSERLRHTRNQAGLTIMVSHVDVTEHVFDRSIDFTVQYWFMPRGMQTLLADAGMFRQFQGTSFEEWKSRMSDFEWRSRGISNLHFKPGEDTLVDPCNTELPQAINPQVNSFAGESQAKSLTNVCPPKDQSYSDWINVIETWIDTNLIEHKPMAAPASPSVPAQTNPDSIQSADPTVPPVATPPGEQKSTFQQSGNATNKLIMSGHGVRIGHKVELPLKAYTMNDGTNLELVKPKIKETVVGMATDGCPIYAAKWRLEYAVKPNDMKQVRAQLGPLSELNYTEEDPNGNKTFGEE